MTSSIHTTTPPTRPAHRVYVTLVHGIFGLQIDRRPINPRGGCEYLAYRFYIIPGTNTVQRVRISSVGTPPVHELGWFGVVTIFGLICRGTVIVPGSNDRMTFEAWKDKVMHDVRTNYGHLWEELL
ncbi:hypothetical protein CC80DRAFT_302965 [Byssothecium circinans]|uniref:Uncharacterized protein n=1 Tax=Byssothecium circinans TaxID=147558 RepID=A0A6A5U9K5_9PLEO|nr:hypothetical protein CC80DRAFT_302965 [Byssothecium circinans]